MIAAAVAVGPHEVLQVERRLAEEFRAALVLQHQQLALDGADGRGLRDVAVSAVGAVSVGMLRPTNEPSIARRSLRSSSSSPCSSATRKAMLSTPSWTSLRSISRDSSSGPISEMVARIGWPCSPNRSQNTTGNSSGSIVEAQLLARARRRPAWPRPTCEMPERSPLMSAAKTGTPAREKPSASTCRVTVLPVPVAPVTSPWRLARRERQNLRLACSCRRKSCRPDRPSPWRASRRACHHFGVRSERSATAMSLACPHDGVPTATCQHDAGQSAFADYTSPSAPNVAQSAIIGLIIAPSCIVPRNACMQSHQLSPAAQLASAQLVFSHPCRRYMVNHRERGAGEGHMDELIGRLVANVGVDRRSLKRPSASFCSSSQGRTGRQGPQSDR